VTRGLNSKVEKGWFPHKAPEGYLNQNGIIVQDIERFPLVRRAWELMLTGTYTPPQILDIMTREWGYTSKKLKKVGGAPFTRTSIYNLFSNLFYTGYFKRNGEIFPGQHPPMVSMEEFLRVQGHLSRRFKKRKRTHDFAYSGLMECGECGRAVVGERKTVKLKSGGANEHVYYACANTRSGCSRKSVTKEQVDAQIQKLLVSISIPAPIMEMGHEVVQEWQKEQGQSDPIEQELTVLEREIAGARRKRDRLLDMRMSDLLSDFEYLEQKERLTGHLNAALVRQQELRDQSGSWQENLQNVLHLAACGELAFEMGESALRSLIAKTLGARYVLTHKNLAVELNPVFAPLCEIKARLETNRLENRPPEYEKAPGSGSGSRSEGDSSRIRQLWWNTLDAIRMAFLQSNYSVPRLEGFACVPLVPPLFAARRAQHNIDSKRTE